MSWLFPGLSNRPACPDTFGNSDSIAGHFANNALSHPQIQLFVVKEPSGI